MQTSIFVKITTVAAAVLLLAACSTPKNTVGANSQNGGQPASAQNAAGNRSAAEAYAMQQSAGYKAGNNSQLVQNSTKVPSNQTYYFSFDQSAVGPNDIRFIRAQATYLASHPSARVRLEGNTDNRGSREYNIGLGWRRDQAVDRILIQEGVSKDQIQMVSYGKEHPVAQGDNSRVWALNRRVNLIYKVY